MFSGRSPLAIATSRAGYGLLLESILSVLRPSFDGFHDFNNSVRESHKFC
ncbi:hypothetical protein LINGRAPRIM_LOCUS2730 [Linum grandiflorum]